MMGNDDDFGEVDVPHWFDIHSQIRQLCATASAKVDEEPGSAIEQKKYVEMLTSGDEDEGKRATLAFSAACAAISMDFNTVVFLIGDGSHWAYEGACNPVAQPGFPPLGDLIDSFLNLGGRIYICAACDQVSNTSDKAKGDKRRRQRIQTLGLAPVLTHMVGSTSVTF
jgi:predicted peroxiredoxin